MMDTGLADRIAIQDVVSVVTLHGDLDEPAQAAAHYAPDAVINAASLYPDWEGVDANLYRARVAHMLGGFDARQHQVTNFDIRVDGDEATCRSQMRSIHFIADDTWTVYGTYHHRLCRTAEGWKIAYQRMDLIGQVGRHLLDVAKARADQRAAEKA